MSLADELLADLDDIGDELGNEENDQVPYLRASPHACTRSVFGRWLYVYNWCYIYVKIVTGNVMKYLPSEFSGGHCLLQPPILTYVASLPR